MRYRVTSSDGWFRLIRYFATRVQAMAAAIEDARDFGASTVALDSSSRIVAAYERGPAGSVRLA